MDDNTHAQSKRGMSTGAKLMIAAALFIIAAVAQYIYMNGANWFDWGTGASRELRMTDTGKGVSYDFDASASFYSYDAKYFYFCTKDGVQYISSNGDLKWQEIFSLTRPLMCGSGDVIAVGEAKGKHIYVFNADGFLYDVSFDHPVSYFTINRAGYLSVILQPDVGYEVHIYNQRNRVEPLFSSFIQGTNEYPVAVDVSEDGKYAVIALWDLNVRMVSHSVFYYVNKRDAGPRVDGYYAGQKYPDEMVYCVKFMANNYALVFTDRQIVCYRLGEGNELTREWAFELHNKLDMLAFYGERFAFVTGDRLLNDDEAEGPGVVQIYDLTGTRTGVFDLGRKATYLGMGHDSVMVGADRSFYALDYRGGLLWEYITMRDTNASLFLDNTDTVLMAGGTQASIMKRLRPKTDAPADIDTPLDFETPLTVETPFETADIPGGD